MKEKPMIMKYRDELDKSYGVAGMALGLSVLDASDLFTEVTLDGDDTGCIQFTPEFFFAGNPRLSPRGAWKYILGHYRYFERMYKRKDFMSHFRKIWEEDKSREFK